MQCFRNVCKKDLRDCMIDTQTWESLADDRDLGKRAVRQGTITFEDSQRKKAEVKRMRRKEKATTRQSHPSKNSDYIICNLCGRDCGAFIGLHNHKRKCYRTLSTDSN